jgi:hypothetical protein
MHYHAGIIDKPLKTTLGFLILCVFTFSLNAQTPPSPSAELQTLANVRTAFTLQINTQSQKLTDQYERALARLEAEVADSGDYEQALQIKTRRDQLQQFLAANRSISSLNLPLTPLAAKGIGIASTTDGSLTGWRSASHYAEWTLTKLAPGEYYLELDSQMIPIASVSSSPSEEPAETALFEIHEVSLLPGTADNRRTFELQLTKARNPEFTSHRIGPMRFARSPVTLRMAASKSNPTNLVTFKNMRLVPAPSAIQEQENTTTNSSITDVPSLRSALASALQLAYKPISDRYSSKLQELALQHPEWKPLLDNEKKGLDNRLSKPSESKPNDTLNLPKPLASLGGISGFQDLDGVTFLDHPDNTGDRFLVSHDGKEFFIRLLWLRCASPAAEQTPTSAPNPFTQHFALATGDAALFGRAALQFTSGYLTGKTIRLLARNTPDSDGTIPALLFLSDIGLFHNLLIDQGLAAVVGKPGNGGTLERALQHSILDREKEAQSRSPRPGAWALSPIPPQETPKP